MTIKRIDTNIDQLANGHFRVDLYLTNRITGHRQRIRKTFPTLSTAREFRRIKKAENELNLWQTREGIPTATLGDIIELAKLEKIRSYHQRHKGRHLQPNATPPTYDDMLRHMEEIRQFFGEDTRLATIGERQINHLTEYLLHRPKGRWHKGTLSNQSVDHCLKELRYLLRLAGRKHLIDTVPTVHLLGNYGERVFDLDLESFIRVVNHLPEPPHPHRAFMLMALNTGQRSGDLSAMCWHQVKADHIVYKSSKTQREGIKAPLMSITKNALTELRQSLPHHGKEIFLNPRTQKPIKSIRKSLHTACKLANVNLFTIHHIRHLATTVLLEYTNGDRDLVKRIIGWSNMSMIERYGHIGQRANHAFAEINHRLDGKIRLAKAV